MLWVILPLFRVKRLTLTFSIRRKEEFSRMLSEQSLRRWKRFLTEPQPGRDRIAKGTKQWEEIDSKIYGKVIDCQGRYNGARKMGFK